MLIEWLPFSNRASVVLVLMGSRAAVVGVTFIAPIVSSQPPVHSGYHKNDEVYKWRMDAVNLYDISKRISIWTVPWLFSSPGFLVTYYANAEVLRLKTGTDFCKPKPAAERWQQALVNDGNILDQTLSDDTYL